jgi:hypothetical protein
MSIKTYFVHRYYTSNQQPATYNAYTCNAYTHTPVLHINCVLRLDDDHVSDNTAKQNNFFTPLTGIHSGWCKAIPACFSRWGVPIQAPTQC